MFLFLLTKYYNAGLPLVDVYCVLYIYLVNVNFI